MPLGSASLKKASGPAPVPTLSGNTANDPALAARLGTAAAEDPGTLQSGGSGAIRCWPSAVIGARTVAPRANDRTRETTILSSTFMRLFGSVDGRSADPSYLTKAIVVMGLGAVVKPPDAAIVEKYPVTASVPVSYPVT
jgi:hypothetical protein